MTEVPNTISSAVYALSDLERAELALGLTCVRVCRLTGVARIVGFEQFVKDETRFEYFGRPDIEFEQELPASFLELALYCEDQDQNPLVVLSATVLNAIDDYVDQHFPSFRAA